MAHKKFSILISMLALAFLSGCSPDIKHNEYGISIMSFNVLYDSTENANSTRAIQDADPDILCLRELTPAFSKLFQSQFSKKYPYSVFKTKNGTWGAGIASKFPITKAKYFPVKPHRLPALEAIIETRQGKILMSCLHLFPPFSRHTDEDSYLETMRKNETLRQNQAKYLITRYQDNTLPMILLGDMNENSNDLALEVFVKHDFIRACEHAKLSACGSTYPANATFWFAMFEIDHILGKDVTFHSANVIKQGGSDHYPVMASFSINKKY